MRYNSVMNKLRRKISAKIPRGSIIYYLMTVGIVYILHNLMGFRELYNHIYFSKGLILRGQIWRLVTFLLTPLYGYGLLGAIFFLLFTYFVVTRIEAVWGPADTIIFLGFSAVAQVICGMIFGYADFSFTLLYTITFIYSIYFSNDTVYMSFLIPIKVKYFSIVLGAIILYQLWINPIPVKMSILASLLVFFIYFRKYLFESLRLFVRRLNNRMNRR